MGAQHVVVGFGSPPGRRPLRWLIGLTFGVVLGGCGAKFAPAAIDDGDPDGGSAAMPGTGGTDGSGGGGAGGTSGGGGTAGTAGSAGGTTDSGPPDSNPGDARFDVPVTPQIPLSGLILWLRADLGISRDQDLVTEWKDQSGAGNHATQPAQALRPRLVGAAINGGPSVDFDGMDDLMLLPAGFEDFTDGISIFVVTLQHSTDQCSALVHLSKGTEIDDITLGQFDGFTLYEVKDEYFAGEAFPTGSAQLLAVIHGTDGAFVVRRNGRPSSAGTAALPAEGQRTQNFVGDDLYPACGTYPGQISEILLYERAVVNDELFAIERYLRDRSGIR